MALKGKNVKRLSFYFIFIIFLLFGIWLTGGFDSHAQVFKVRVGVFELKGFCEKNEKRELSGYEIDYLEKIAELNGWEYEYIWTDSWESCVKLLREGKVELIAPALETEPWLEEFAYSNYSIGMESGALITMDSNEQLVYEDYEAFGNIKIGCAGSLTYRKDFTTYAESHDFIPNYIIYRNSDIAMKALREGKIDAVVANLFLKAEDQKILARLGGHPFYFIMNKDSVSRMEELNETLQIIKSDYGDFEEGLLKKYYPEYSSVPFSKTEHKYIEEAPVFRVACRSNQKPISFVNEETGEVEGINRDILDRISEISGLKFEYVALSEEDITYDMLRELNISLIAQVEDSESNRKTPGLHLTNSYLDTKKVFVCKDEKEFDSSKPLNLAVATGSQTLISVIENTYPNFHIVKCDNMEGCFEAVRNGEADALLQNQYAIIPYLARPVYSDLVTIPIEGLDDKLCMSPVDYKGDVSGEKSYLADKRLISILNKSIRQIGEEETNRIIIGQTARNQYKYTMEDFLYQYRYTIIIFGIVFVLVVILIILLVILRRKNEKIVKENEKKHEILINNSGDIIFEIDCIKRRVKVSPMFEKKFGWIMPDDRNFEDAYEIPEILKCHENSKGEINKSITYMLEKKKNVESLIQIMKSDGSALWCRVSQYPMLDSKGTMIYVMGKILDVDKDIHEKEELLEKSRIDTLTGILNKTTFFVEVEEKLKQAEGSEALIFIDIDNFKQVNDTLGHLAGDAVIKETADKLKNIFGSRGILSRFGGDEFCIYIMDIDEPELKEKLDYIVKQLDIIYQADGKEVRCSASAGVVYTSGKGKKLESLVETADKALYQAKRRGKNQYVISHSIKWEKE